MVDQGASGCPPNGQTNLKNKVETHTLFFLYFLIGAVLWQK
jgi:hypothetical protein